MKDNNYLEHSQCLCYTEMERGVFVMRNQIVIKKIVNYIEEHLEEDLSLDHIAGVFHYSKFYLAKVFAEETESTIYQYIKGRRLTLAAEKLVETKQPIVDIAFEARYNSQQAFTLAFQQLYHCTPQVYRKSRTFYPGQSRIHMQSTCIWGFSKGRAAA